MKNILTQGLTQLNLPADAAGTLEKYGNLLIAKNESMNLTAITEPTQVARLHMLDCAAILNAADFKGKTVLDVGTGAGFPGMVLKCIEPTLSLTLLDSLNKRIEWLREIAPELGIDDLTALHGRAEEFGQMEEYRQQFDIVTSRAVADLRMLCELCLPFVKVGGLFLAMKGPGAQDEKNSAGRCVSILGGRFRKDLVYDIPGADAGHRVVIVEKIAPTPPAYPRRFSKMKKSPL